MSVHPTAIVCQGATIGRNVTIGPHCFIDDGVEIGDECTIAHRATLLSGTILGARCRVHAGAVLGDAPQDLSYDGFRSYVWIGAGTVIREGVTVHRATIEDGATIIGERCFLMANSHVGHDARVGNEVILANGTLLAGHVQVGDRAFLSGNCLVHQFTRIGRLAMLSGGTAVQMDVPPFTITRSTSSNCVMGLNVVGLRRAGYSSADRAHLKDAFDLLYRSGMPVRRCLDRLENSPSPLVRELAAFVRSSQRGICKFAGDDSSSSANDLARAA